MRERNREIRRRRQRYQKRTRLRVMFAKATDDTKRKEIDEKIRKTYPKYTPPS